MLRKTIALFMLALAIGPLNMGHSESTVAQSNARDEGRLLESGKSDKLVEPVASDQIRIVSYNIRWRSGEELQQIVHWLRESYLSNQPTIIGLQEVDRAKKRSGNINHAKAIADALGMYYAWTAPSPPAKARDQEEETGVELLSPYPLTDIARIVLPNAGPGGRSRVALGATIKIGKTAIRVYSVHSETRLPMLQKVEQLRAVIEDLARFPKTEPAVVVGDFNSWELPAIDGIRKLFTDAGFTTPLPDDETTFLRKTSFFDLRLKLDWIWVRGLTPRSYGIDRSLTVSDHFPLWTVLKF
jgi:endonuclease/exonuclease/phosphatase family metal-dependent hydrolase